MLSGAALAVAGTAVGLKKIDYDRIPQTAMLASVFFVGSLVHVPLFPTSVHLVLNGLVGLMLGWAAFPAILVALLLQSLFFHFGGITVLGVNTVIMAAPAVVCHYVFFPMIRKKTPVASVGAFCCGFFSVFLAAAIAGLVLISSSENFWEVSSMLVLSNLPVMIVEGLVIVFAVGFLKKVQPELLPGYAAIPVESMPLGRKPLESVD